MRYQSPEGNQVQESPAALLWLILNPEAGWRDGAGQAHNANPGRLGIGILQGIPFRRSSVMTAIGALPGIRALPMIRARHLHPGNGCRNGHVSVNPAHP